jgi:hypothetical protein
MRLPDIRLATSRERHGRPASANEPVPGGQSDRALVAEAKVFAGREEEDGPGVVTWTRTCVRANKTGLAASGDVMYE